mmetsp:Transcript_41641/g.47957  ORF Transcript_41641/g.47957 Transcript_41641/m.47957 type:complete len:167 (-) Transcript_41641:194-694(-)|eukprot:CAMPEP_0114995912 /NCGR_PEP_ID=MMETSP0216-20121206/14008_1 /TAXON_ID=223996 /ORGANISM="Protocruzia adherens, Strain Boccale" /LENGTH=166 /DNA_ID=CAMNT_0002360037 /DNA_START=24 /DNA_END=524 /DNA_ORIENTATION=-
MSWQPYVDTQLLQKQTESGPITNANQHAAILSTKGEVLASSPGFSLGDREVEVATEEGGSEKITMNEVANLVDAMENKGVTAKKGGLRLNGEKYYLVHYDVDTKTAYLKKHEGGACVAKTAQTHLLAIFSQSLQAKNPDGSEVPQNPGLTNGCVEGLATALSGAGF